MTTQKMVLKPNFKRTVDGHPGMAVAIVQNAKTKDILMQGFVSEEAWRRALETKMACLFSTSREELWTKGQTSGNFMKVVDMLVDCDGDSVIYLVEPQGDGVACHTGAVSCFYRSILTGAREHAPKEGKDEDLKAVAATVG
jgi:phosphoribosyl-AMP cyclohydrolase